MNSINKFDIEFLATIDKELIYIKMLRKIFKYVAIALMLIPMKVSWGGLAFMSWMVMMFEAGYFRKITFVREKEKNISIYEKFKYLPVDFIDFYNLRKTELDRENIRYLLICLLVQNASAIFFNMWTLASVYIPVLASCLIYLSGYLIIKIPKKCL